MTQPDRNWMHGRVAAWAAALVVVGMAVQRLHRYYPSDTDASGNSDAFHTYLPAARRLLSHGWEFLLNDPFSTRVAPLGYFWPAIWGADVTMTRWANGALFVLSALIMAIACRRLGGWIGAAIGSLLLLYHPGIAYYMPKILTEPLYLLGLMLFSWALIEMLLAPRAPTRRWLLLGTTGLTVTLLTRPALQLIVVACIALLLVGSLIPRTQTLHPKRKQLATMLISACILPALIIAKNGIQFDLWSLGTGSGAGLYYGVNPLRLGHEPAFMGFEYDIGAVVRAADPSTGGEPLDRTADRIERHTALAIVTGTEPKDLLSFFAYKLRSWLLYSTPELGFDKRLRIFRVFEWLCIIGAAILWTTRRLLRRQTNLEPTPLSRSALINVLLAIGVFAMAIQLTPLLYNTRYNAGFIEPWLILLTASAVGYIFSSSRDGVATWSRGSSSWPKIVILSLLLASAIAATNWSARHESLPLDPHRLGPASPVLWASNREAVMTNARNVGDNAWVLQDGAATIEIALNGVTEPTPELDFMDGVWRIQLRVKSTEPRRCRNIRMELDNPAGELGWPKPTLRIIPDGRWHTYAIHGNYNLRPTGLGKLRVHLHCKAGTEFAFGGVELLKSTMPEAARASWINGIGIDPYTPTFMLPRPPEMEPRSTMGSWTKNSF